MLLTTRIVLSIIILSQYIIDPGVMSFNLNLPMKVIIGSIPIIHQTTLPVAPQSYYPENVDIDPHQPIRIGFEERECILNNLIHYITNY